jgi:chaperonin GroEL
MIKSIRKLVKKFTTTIIETESEKKIQKNKFDYVRLAFGSEARQKILKGVTAMSDTVSATYGPLGKNVLIDYDNKPVITKDGVTVAKNVQLTARSENIGCRMLSVCSGSTNEYAGDGTTTSTVLAGEIIKRGVALVDIGFHPLDIKRGIDHSLNVFLKELDKNKVRIRNKTDLQNLAMITTNKNKEISEIVSEAILTLGVSSMISLEESPTGDNKLIIYQGMSLTFGMATKEFTSDNE